MELKYYLFKCLERCKYCSNRTFMELKLGVLQRGFAAVVGSNRTFMELKCGYVAYVAKHG